MERIDINKKKIHCKRKKYSIDSEREREREREREESMNDIEGQK